MRGLFAAFTKLLNLGGVAVEGDDGRPKTFEFRIDLELSSMEANYWRFGDGWYCDNNRFDVFVSAAEIEPVPRRGEFLWPGEIKTNPKLDNPFYRLVRFSGQPVLGSDLADQVQAFLAGEPSEIAGLGVWDSDGGSAHVCLHPTWQVMPTDLKSTKHWPRPGDWAGLFRMGE